ncbi:MAG TPA: hypothetical protein VM123_09105 [archaeon]|nr:hypothetical protein [archaeon]
MFRAEKDILPRFVLMAWVWLFAATVVTGWTWVWGMIPWGKEAGIWTIPVALVSTVLILGIRPAPLQWILDKVESISVPALTFKRFHSPAAVFVAAVSVYAALVCIAWFLRSRNYFMGDGLVYIGYVVKPFFLQKNEPLDFFVHQMFYRLVSFFGLSQGEAAYAVLHCLLLPFFLLICWKIASIVSSCSTLRLALWVLIISTSSLQLFFGYVESYTLAHLILTLYLYYGLRHLREKNTGNTWLPTALFVLASLCHMSAIVLFPSLLYIWLAGLISRASSGMLGLNSRIVGLVSAGILVLMLFSINSELLVPVKGEIDGLNYPYRMFELRHLWDKFNFLLLIAPAAVVFLFIIFTKARSFLKIADPAYVFVFWAAAGCSFFSFVFNPALGIRDWDLLSLPAVPLTLCAGWGLILLWPSGESKKACLAALAVTAWTHALTWVWVNSDTDRGVGFLDRVSQVDLHKGPVKLQLAYTLAQKGYIRQAIRQYQGLGGFNKQKTELDIGYLFLDLNLPDSTLFYCRPHAGESEDSEISKSGLIAMSIAYDMAGYPDSASTFFLKVLGRDRGLDEKIRRLWVSKMLQTAVRYNYNQKIMEKPGNANLIAFFLRYYTIKRDEINIKNIYSHILRNSFAMQDWLSFIRYAELCGHDSFLRPLIVKAVREYPEIKEYLSSEI